MRNQTFPKLVRNNPIMVLLPWLELAMEGTVIGVLDVLKSVNLLAKIKWPSAEPPVQWQFIGEDAKPLHMELFSCMASTPISSIEASRRLLVLPAFHVANSGQIGLLLDRYPAVIDLVKSHADNHGSIVACGNGLAFVAAAGLLRGEKVTSSWIHRRWFEASFPSVDFSGSDPVNIVRSVFVSVARDTQQAALVAAIGGLLGEGLAHACESLLRYNPDRQEQIHELLLRDLIKKTSDTPAFKAAKWLERHIQLPLDIGQMAADISSSERTILRHFKEAYNMTPVEFLQKLRIDRAKVLLEITQQDIAAIAEACGYQDATSLRRIFKKSTGDTPGAYRAKYSLRAKERKLWRTVPLTTDAAPE